MESVLYTQGLPVTRLDTESSLFASTSADLEAASYGMEFHNLWNQEEIVLDIDNAKQIEIKDVPQNYRIVSFACGKRYCLILGQKFKTYKSVGISNIYDANKEHTFWIYDLKDDKFCGNPRTYTDLRPEHNILMYLGTTSEDKEHFILLSHYKENSYQKYRILFSITPPTSNEQDIDFTQQNINFVGDNKHDNPQASDMIKEFIQKDCKGLYFPQITISTDEQPSLPTFHALGKSATNYSEIYRYKEQEWQHTTDKKDLVRKDYIEINKMMINPNYFDFAVKPYNPFDYDNKDYHNLNTIIASITTYNRHELLLVNKIYQYNEPSSDENTEYSIKNNHEYLRKVHKIVLPDNNYDSSNQRLYCSITQVSKDYCFICFGGISETKLYYSFFNFTEKNEKIDSLPEPESGETLYGDTITLKEMPIVSEKIYSQWTTNELTKNYLNYLNIFTEKGYNEAYDIGYIGAYNYSIIQFNNLIETNDHNLHIGCGCYYGPSKLAEGTNNSIRICPYIPIKFAKNIQIGETLQHKFSYSKPTQV